MKRNQTMAETMAKTPNQPIKFSQISQINRIFFFFKVEIEIET
jgi:hypothetical protein